MNFDRVAGGEAKGVALVAALLVMVVISLIATALMMTVNTNTKLSALDVRETQALRIAEAGVAEAVARLRRGDITDQGNPRMVAQIFLASDGRLPPIGADSLPVATGQPEGAWLTYSTASPGPDALTIEYKTDRSRTKILRYDGNQTPPVQDHSGSAIFRITSTGRKGEARRRIVTEVTQRAFDLSLKGAIAAGVGVGLSGQAVVCGFNDRVDTPAHAGDPGQTGPGGCNENAGLKQWETGDEDLPGIWCTGEISLGTDGRPFGAPPRLAGQVPLYEGPWEVLGMSREAFQEWIGPWGSVRNPIRHSAWSTSTTTLPRRTCPDRSRFMAAMARASCTSTGICRSAVRSPIAGSSTWKVTSR